MGLYVRVFKNIKVTEDKDNYNFIAYVIDDNWKYKIKNLEYDKYYKGDNAEGCVDYSYIAHNIFRKNLIKIIGRNDLLLEDGKIDWVKLVKEKNMPFYELINFADNEGCLDFEISSILYNNFVEWKDKAIKLLGDDDYNIQKYLDWLNVFKNGKKIDSVVVFH